MCSVVQFLHTSDRELQVTLRDVALVLVVKLFSILRHKLSGCTQTYIVDSLLSRNRGCVTVDWEHLRDLEQFLSSEPDVPRFPGVLWVLGLCSLFFSLPFVLWIGWFLLSVFRFAHCFCVLSSWLRGFKSFSLLFTFFCFSSYTFSFGVSIWFFFQISLLHRDHHRVSIPSCYSWTIL